MEEKPTDMLKELVVAGGDIVEIKEPTCLLWRADHPNCRGCPSELGCSKLVKCGLLMLNSTVYTPTSYDDFAKMHDRIASLQQQVLEAKSVEELDKVPMH